MRLLHSRPMHNFAGYVEAPVFETADAVVIPVPYDSTTSYGSGARKGPAAIIDASRQIEWFDEELGVETASKVSFYTLDELEPSMNGPEETLKRVEDVVGDVLEVGKFPIILGGEHSITAGAIRAFQKNVSVLQLDAHADLREEFEGTRFNHACAMKRVLETHDFVGIGIRSMCKEEAELISGKKLNVHTIHEDWTHEQILSELKDEVYVSIDLDAFDSSVMPATGTPQPGGMLWKEVTGLLRKIAKNKRIVGFDVCELAPIPGFSAPDFLAAKLAYRLAGYAFAEKLGLRL